MQQQSEQQQFHFRTKSDVLRHSVTNDSGKINLHKALELWLQGADVKWQKYRFSNN